MGFDLEELGGGKNGDSDQKFSIWVKDKIPATGGASILEAVKAAYSHETIDQTDGIKIFRGTSWALVRTSGTEPLIRIIIDSGEQQQGRALHNELIGTIQSITGKLC